MIQLSLTFKYRYAIWNTWLLNGLTFAIFGALFLQPRDMRLTILLMVLAFITILMQADMRQGLLRIFNDSNDPDLRWITWPFLAWFVASAISIWNGPQSLFTYLRNSPAFVYLLALSLLVLSRGHRPQEKWLLWGLIAGSITAFGYIVYGLSIFDFNLSQLRKWIGLAVRFGNWSMLVAMLLVLSSALAIRMPLRWRISLIAVAGLAFFASVLSLTRSSFLAFFIFGLLIILAPKKDRLHRYLVWIGLSGVLLCSFWVLGSSELRQKLRLTSVMNDIVQTEIGNYDTSIGARFVLWEASWEIFQHHPYVGAGPGSFQSELENMIHLGAVPAIPLYRHAHSDILHTLATSGIIGLLAYIGIIIGPIVFFWRRLRSRNLDSHLRLYSMLGLLTVGSVFIFGLTNATLYRSFDSATYALLICALASQLFPIKFPRPFAATS